MADITKFFDKEFEQKEFSELVNAPVEAIAGVSKAMQLLPASFQNGSVLITFRG